MKNKISRIVFCLLTILFLSSEKIVNYGLSQTLFILVDGKDGNYLQKTIHNNDKHNECSNTVSYDLYFPSGKKLRLLYREFLDFDTKSYYNTPCFSVHRKFLKNNKKEIIDIVNLHKKGYSYALDTIKESKSIFIIDMSEMTGKQILIKEVQLMEAGSE